MIFRKANSDSDRDDVLAEHPQPDQGANQEMSAFDFDMAKP